MDTDENLKKQFEINKKKSYSLDQEKRTDLKSRNEFQI